MRWVETFLLLGAATSIYASPVLAQDAKPAAAEADSSGSGGEILVTARKREESLVDVPVAITAFSQDALEKQQIGGLLDVGMAVPSLVIAASQGSQNGATVYMRGIGQDNSDSLDEPGVGIYVDGVYMGQAIGALLDMNNFNRIEVLRGPQGTLYGRNTPGGAIKLVSQRPDLKDFHVKGDFTVGSFNRLDVRGSVNVPVSDTFAFTMSAINLTNDGYYKHALTGADLNKKDTSAVRGTALWEPTSNLSFFATVDYAKDRSGLNVGTPFAISDSGALTTLYGSYYKAAPDIPDINKYDGGGSLQVDLKTGMGTLSSISAWRKFRYNQSFDFGASPVGADLYRHLKANQFSQEFQFVSQLDGMFNFVAGLYYYRQHTKELFDFLVNAVDADPFYEGTVPKLDFPYYANQVVDSYSAYGEAYLTPTTGLTITGGLRYTIDHKKITRDGSPGTGSASSTFRNLSPKVNVDYSFAPHAHAYVTWSKGYKAGAYQPFPSTSTAFSAIPPEIVTAWEVGAKAELFDRLMSISIAAYHNAYNNLQLSLADTGGVVTANSADLRVKGIETEITLNPMRGLSISGSFTVADSKFTRVPGTAGAPTLNDKQKNLPPYQIRVAPSYEFAVGDDAKVEMSAAFTATGKDYKIVPDDSFLLQKAFQTVDARIAFRRPEQGWSIALAGENLTDTRYFNTATMLGGASSSVRWYAPGRTWSVRLGVDS